MNIAEGTWVRIHTIILKAEERSDQLPEDTRKVPLEMWVKGTLKTDANIGDSVLIETATGRLVRGILTEENPSWNHGFGTLIPELEEVGRLLKKTVRKYL